MTPLSNAVHSPVDGSQPTRVAETAGVAVRRCPETTARTKRNSRHARREELAISNLITFPTISQAASATRVSEKTLRRWLGQPAFARRFQTAKRSVLDRSMDALLRGSEECAATLVRLATDKKSPAAARVRAATKVIELTMKTVQLTEIEERLARIEAALQKRRAM